MSDMPFALSTLAPFVYPATVIVTLLVICQVVGLDPARHVNRMVEKLAGRKQTGRTHA